MNNGAFGENFPYSNFHDLNMDWIIKIAKDFLDQYTHIQETIEDGLDRLEEKATALEEALQAWYDEHGEDIATQLVEALDDIANALTSAISEFNAEAEQTGQRVIDSIPLDYTALSNKVTVLDTAISAYWLIRETLYVTYNIDTHTLTIPGNTFAVYKGVPAGVSQGVNLDVTNKLATGACNLWMLANHTVIAEKFYDKPSQTDAIYLGSIYDKYVFINGINLSNIKIISSSGTHSPYVDNHGSFIGMQAQIVTIVVNKTDRTITFPGGFKVYRGQTSAFSQTTITYPNATACKIYLTNDFTLYATDWSSSGVPTNTDDDCIGVMYGNTIHINGVPDYAFKINTDGVTADGCGLYFGDAYVGIDQTFEASFNYDTKQLHIDAGFSIYRGIGKGRSAIDLDLTSALNNGPEACILYMTKNYVVYAQAWNSAIFGNPVDEILGYIFRKTVILNGIKESQISVISSDNTVYCFGDSIPAGTATTKNFLQFLHEYNRNTIFKNYCVGSTGYYTEASGTVIAGNGSTNNGTSTTVSGNNNIYQKMNSVQDAMSNILISAGTNDWSQNVTTANFTTSVRNALNLALQHTQNVFVLLPIKREGWATQNNTLGLKLKDYSDIIKTECESRGIVYFDGYNVFLNPTISGQKTNFVPDGLHPNEKGHRRIAKAIFSTVQQAVAN